MGYKFKIPRVFGKNLIAGLAVPLLAALRAGLIKLAIWAALLGTTTVTLAFEGYEHRQIGDAAFFVALSYMERVARSRELQQRKVQGLLRRFLYAAGPSLSKRYRGL